VSSDTPVERLQNFLRYPDITRIEDNFPFKYSKTFEESFGQKLRECADLAFPSYPKQVSLAMREEGFHEGDLVITRTSNFGDIEVFVHPIIQNKDSVKAHLTELGKTLEFCKHFNLSTIVINFDDTELPP
jgi:hypothetical protein